METTFKAIIEPDLTKVKEIYDWYIENSTATFHTEPILIDQLREFLYIGHPVYNSFLIYQNKEVAGFCFLTNFKKRQAYDRTAELTIYLKPEYCNQGIGSIALDYLEHKAIENGIKNLIGVISGDNSGSIRLFEKSGFSKCAHYKRVGEKFNNVLDVLSFQKEI